MKFEDYCKPFEGDFFEEGIRLLGDNGEEYSRLQDLLDRSNDPASLPDHLENVKQFYNIAARARIPDLGCRVDPHSKWMAEDISSRISGTNIVDLGCCDGFFTVFYAINHPDKEFVGIDISEDAIEFARRRSVDYNLKNTTWICDNALKPNSISRAKKADTVIMQDLLYQIFGTNDTEMEAGMLKMISQDPTKIAIISGEGNTLTEKAKSIQFAKYGIERHRVETLHDKYAGSNVTMEVATFKSFHATD